MVVSDQLHEPAALAPSKKTRCRLNRMLGGPQDLSGWFAGAMQKMLSIGLYFRQNQYDKISKFRLIAMFIIGRTQNEWRVIVRREMRPFI